MLGSGLLHICKCWHKRKSWPKVFLTARRPPHWRYNLFAMVHGKKRQPVRSQIAAAELACGLYAYPSAVLFSTRCFKQSGARYFSQLKGAA